MSSARSPQVSLMRRPAAYAVSAAIAGTAPRTAASKFFTSLPLRMSGCLCGTFGHASLSAISGRSNVTP